MVNMIKRIIQEVRESERSAQDLSFVTNLHEHISRTGSSDVDGLVIKIADDDEEEDINSSSTTVTNDIQTNDVVAPSTETTMTNKAFVTDESDLITTTTASLVDVNTALSTDTAHAITDTTLSDTEMPQTTENPIKRCE